MPEIAMTKEANEHLIAVGEKLAAAKIERETAFISHTVEDGRTFIKGDWKPLLDGQPSSLQTHSLQGVVDYLEKNPDGLNLSYVLVHVATPTDVFVRSTPFGAHRQRCNYMQVEAVLPNHKFNQWTDPDIFVPYLQSCFCDSGDLASLVAMCSNIAANTEISLKDDGVSQEATVVSGAVRKGKKDVPNPVVLYPFSTFAEVDQPPRKFVFRLKAEPLSCILLEADGGAWKLDALQRLAAWLNERVPSEVKVIA
jgi:hypothetical protein